MWRPWPRSAKSVCSVAGPLFAFTLVGASVHVGAAAPVNLPPQDEAIRQVTAAVSLTAAIDTSANAVGVAESELFYMTPEEVDTAMDTMESMGVTQVRMFVPWYFVEPAPGVYNWANVDKVVNAAEERGIAVLGAVTSTPTWATDSWSPYGAPRNPEDFGNFMGALAERYGAGEGAPESARISAYEIWNEPHAAVFWEPRPDAAAYTEVLKAGYEAVKAVDPSGTVVGGVVYAGQSWGDGYNIGAVEFIEAMYDAGAAGYFDALSYHPYNSDWRFSDGAGSPISAIGILEDIQGLMAQNGDAAKTVWTSEYGLPTATVSEAQQAEFIDDFMDTWADLDGAGPMFLYNLVDLDTTSTNPEDTYGLFRDDWTPKQAALAVQAWIEENGPLATGEVPAVEDPTLPTEPEPAAPTPATPVDPVAQAIANWQQALADAAANWAAAWGQALNPTSTTTVSARTAVDSEPVDAVTEANVAARAADTAEASDSSTPPDTEDRSSTADSEQSTTPSRAALTEAAQAVAASVEERRSATRGQAAPEKGTATEEVDSRRAPRTESVANEDSEASDATETAGATAGSASKPRAERTAAKVESTGDSTDSGGSQGSRGSRGSSEPGGSRSDSRSTGSRGASSND